MGGWKTIRPENYPTNLTIQVLKKEMVSSPTVYDPKTKSPGKARQLAGIRAYFFAAWMISTQIGRARVAPYPPGRMVRG